MKAGRTLQDLATEVERQSAVKRDFLAPTPHLGFDLFTPERTGGEEALVKPQIRMVVATETEMHAFNVTPHAHSQIATRLREHLKADRFSATYNALLERHPDLLAPLVNGLWMRHPETRMVRTLDGRARAFVSDRYRVLDNDLVLDTALRALQESGAHLEIQSAEVTERRLYVKVTFPGIRREVRRGDVVEAGVVISNSEIGQGAVSVQPLIFRLVCLNGMIAGEKLSRYHVGRASGEENLGEIDYQLDTLRAENSAFLLRLRDAIKTAMSEEGFNRTVQRFQLATELPIEGKPTKAVEVLAEKLNFNGDEQESILMHLIKGGDMSQWGLANAVTRASQDVADYDRATEMETAGGRVIELRPEDWIDVAGAGLEDGPRGTLLRDARRVYAQAA